MAVTHDEPGGLRERKRLATRRAIQHAVLTLSLERGIDKVTVEEISRRSNVSPRTFFNYFPSKEAAVVGEGPDLATQGDIEAFVHAGPGGDVFGQLGVLLSASLASVESDREIHQLRRAVLKDNAQLLAMRMATMKDFEAELQEIIQRRFVEDEPQLADDAVALADKALLFTLVATAAIRHAWRSWAENADGTTLCDRIAASFARVYDIVGKTG